MTRADLDELEAIEDRFARLTEELRRGGRLAADRRAGLVTEWVRANHAFHDVIYRVAGLPMVERIAKGARYSGSAVWAPVGRGRAGRALRRERAAAPGAPRRPGGRQLERCPGARARARALRPARCSNGSWLNSLDPIAERKSRFDRRLIGHLGSENCYFGSEGDVDEHEQRQRHPA